MKKNLFHIHTHTPESSPINKFCFFSHEIMKIHSEKKSVSQQGKAINFSFVIFFYCQNCCMCCIMWFVYDMYPFDISGFHR